MKAAREKCVPHRVMYIGLTADFSLESIKAECIGMTCSKLWRKKNLSTEKSMSSKMSARNKREDNSRETKIWENLSLGDLH